MSPGRPPRRRVWWGVALAGACALLGWWWLDGSTGLATASVATAGAAGGPPTAATLPATAAPASSGRIGPPLSALGQAQRREQRELWQARLERARMTLDGYRAAAQYPHESRPIEEHPDQLRPFEPIAEDRALRMPGGSASQGVHLRTTQERVFASGLESSRITLTLQDDAGRTLPLRVTRAVEKEVTPPGRTASTVEVPMSLADNNGVLSTVMQPATQGFANFAGTVRLELMLEHAGQPGFIYFDLTYSPEQAATWLPGVREALNNGSLEFFLRAQVLLPGRYVVSARVDDAQGKPVALALFNGEVARGVAEFRLPVFGKLLRDKQPAFPLTLRDVEAFLLKPDAFPDRVMLPRRVGVVHTSRSYPLASFSDSEWSSEERDRYLTELGKDVATAEEKLRQLTP
jgi:hypothetical protein